MNFTLLEVVTPKLTLNPPPPPRPPPRPPNPLPPPRPPPRPRNDIFALFHSFHNSSRGRRCTAQFCFVLPLHRSLLLDYRRDLWLDPGRLPVSAFVCVLKIDWQLKMSGFNPQQQQQQRMRMLYQQQQQNQQQQQMGNMNRMNMGGQ